MSNLQKIVVLCIVVAAVAGGYLYGNQQAGRVLTDTDTNGKQIDPLSSGLDTTPEAVDTNNETPSQPVSIISSLSGATIDLSDQGLTAVPKNIFGKKAVTKLDLSNNNLQGSLPAEIRLLSDLVELDLSNNDFTGVPAEIGQLTKLQVLDLSDNPITGLPLELGNLSNLKVLDLSGTEYSEFDLEQIKNSLPSSVEIRL